MSSASHVFENTWFLKLSGIIFSVLFAYVLGLLYTFNISRNLSTSSILFEGIFASELDEMW